MLMCIQVCMPNACQCKDGYVLEKDGLPSSENRCIKKENCVGSKSVEKMTKCQREAHDAVQSQDSVVGIVGNFVPVCDKNGDYAQQQFHGSTGYEWCPIAPSVSAQPLNDNFKFQSFMATDEQLANFDETCKSLQTSKCAKAIKKAAKKGDFNFFEAVQNSKQCRLLADVCTWHSCGGSEPTELTVCQKLQMESNEDMNGIGMKPVGQFTPACDENGHFSMEQIHGSTGFQWCPIAPEISAETLSHFKFRSWEISAEQIANWRSTCEKIQNSKCAKDIKKAAKKDNFNFAEAVENSKQCKKLESCTFHSCDENPKKEKLSACQKEQIEIGNLNLIGGYRPTCNEDGDYDDVQRHPSTAYQWCPVAPKVSSEPISEEFKFISHLQPESDYALWEDLCEVIRNSQCAKDIESAAEKKNFNMKKAVKKSAACKKIKKKCTLFECKHLE